MKREKGRIVLIRRAPSQKLIFQMKNNATFSSRDTKSVQSLAAYREKTQQIYSQAIPTIAKKASKEVSDMKRFQSVPNHLSKKYREERQSTPILTQRAKIEFQFSHLKTKGFVKDLPLQSAFQSLFATVNFDQLKKELESLANKAQTHGNFRLLPPAHQNSAYLFYDFLLSHCFKILNFIDPATDNAISLELKKLSSEKGKKDIGMALIAWGKMQCLLCNFFTSREKLREKAIEEIGNLEEKNLLLSDFVEQHSNYSTSQHIKIQVVQLMRPEKKDLICVPAKIVPLIIEGSALRNSLLMQSVDLVSANLNQAVEESSLFNFAIEKIEEVKSPMASYYDSEKDLVSKEVQTDDIIELQKTPELDRLTHIKKFTFKSEVFEVKGVDKVKGVDVKEITYVDFMDRATGPDYEIPTYRNVEVCANMRHPIENSFDLLKDAYSTLEKECVDTKKQTEANISRISLVYEAKIASDLLESKAEIARLLLLIGDLKGDSDRIDQELMACSIDKSSQGIELTELKKKKEMMSIQLNKITLEEEKERNMREELEAAFKIVEEDRIILNSILEISKLETVRLKEENRAYLIQQEATATIVETALFGLEQSKIVSQKAVESERVTRKELEKEQFFHAAYEVRREQEEIEKVIFTKAKNELAGKTSDLERIISKLMEYPDLSLGESFDIDDPSIDEEFIATVHHMVLSINPSPSLHILNQSKMKLTPDRAQQLKNFSPRTA